MDGGYPTTLGEEMYAAQQANIDVDLRVKCAGSDVQFAVHKIVFRVRSEKLNDLIRQMLRHNEPFITIEDTEPEILHRAIQAMYTGRYSRTCDLSIILPDDDRIQNYRRASGRGRGRGRGCYEIVYHNGRDPLSYRGPIRPEDGIYTTAAKVFFFGQEYDIEDVKTAALERFKFRENEILDDLDVVEDPLDYLESIRLMYTCDLNTDELKFHALERLEGVSKLAKEAQALSERWEGALMDLPDFKQDAVARKVVEDDITWMINLEQKTLVRVEGAQDEASNSGSYSQWDQVS